MRKWEYLSVSVSMANRIYVIPPDKVDLSWLPKRVPSVQMRKNTPYVEIIASGDDFPKVTSALIEYLGLEGWEAQGKDNTVMHFKRVKP